MKLYFDSCCYNRPYDDQSQERIHLEGEAVLAIIHKSRLNNDKIMGSPALDIEIEQMNNVEKQEKVRNFYEQTIHQKIEYSSDVYKRVTALSGQTAIRTLDRYHFVYAEYAGVDVLLTTDDQFAKACLKINSNLRVMNPLTYLLEVMSNEYGS